MHPVMGDQFKADATLRLESLFQAMPPVLAMRVGSVDFDGERLRLHAPLEAHLNDKGSAFGGSMTSLMTLAGWGLVMLRLQRHGLRSDVFVADSSVRYRKPLYTELQAQAELAPGESWESFLSTLIQRGRARIGLQARMLLPEGEIAAELSGRYVAMAKG
jgi:thioesterase domain-containing protein